MPIDFDKAIRDRMEENRKALQEQLLTNKLDKAVSQKIENYSQRYGYTVDSVVKELATNEHLQNHILVDPIRQSIHQDLMEQALIEHCTAEGYTYFSSKELKSTYLVDGQLTNKKPETCDVNKSVDFLVSTDNTTYALTLKYTGGEGGAQDNQFNDVINYLGEAREGAEYRGQPLVVGAVLEGAYYRKRMPEIKSKFEADHIICGDVDDVKDRF